MSEDEDLPEPATEEESLPILPPEERITLDLPTEENEAAQDLQPAIINVMMLAYLIAAVVFILLLGSITVVYVRLLEPWAPSWTLWVLVVLALGLTAVWAQGVVNETKRRIPSPLRQKMPINRPNIWISMKSLHQLLHIVIIDPQHPAESDTAIQLATRKSKWSWVVASRLPLIGIVLLTVITWWQSWFTVWFIGVCVLSLWVGWHILAWHSWYLLVTDKRVFAIELPPTWLFWLKAEPFPLLLTKVQSSHPRSQGLGKMANYGEIIADGLGNADNEVFNNMTYIPKAKEVSDIINLSQGA